MAEIGQATAGLPVEVMIDSQNQPCVDKNIVPASSSKRQTQDQLETLPRVADKVPIQVWFVMLISTSERFAFYGLQAPFQNYLQNPAKDPLRPGALGLGQSTATNLSYLFSFIVYLVPMFAAVVIDCYLGRYRGLVVFTGIYLVGASILLVTSIPACLAAGAGLPGFLVSIVIIGIGLGGVKTCMSPFMADQYTDFKDKVSVTKNGQRILIVRDLSIEKIYHMYYWAINIGSLAGLATTFLEKDVGFWAAYLLPFCVLWVSAITLLLCRKKFVVRPPGGNILPKTFRVFTCAMKNRFSMDAARPHNRPAPVDWDDNFVTNLQRSLVACRIFAAYPILWLCHIQILNNLVSQAGQMETHGLPNDIFMNLNPLAILALLPLVQKLLYPSLRKAGIGFPPVNRMAVGFVIEAVAIAYCTGVQQLIYAQGPCYRYPLQCPASDGGRVPNRLTVWVQAPVYIIDGLGEIFFDLASQEYAYNKAPDNMKSIIQAVLSASSGAGAALGFALYPVTRDPYLVYMFSALAATMLVTAVAFWLVFRKYNSVDVALNKQEGGSSTCVARALPPSEQESKGEMEQGNPRSKV